MKNQMNHFFLIVCDSYVSLFMNKCNWSTYFTNENWNCTDADAVCLIECGRVDVNKTEAVKPDGWIDGDCAIKKRTEIEKDEMRTNLYAVYTREF